MTADPGFLWLTISLGLAFFGVVIGFLLETGWAGTLSLAVALALAWPLFAGLVLVVVGLVFVWAVIFVTWSLLAQAIAGLVVLVRGHAPKEARDA